MVRKIVDDPMLRYNEFTAAVGGATSLYVYIYMYIFIATVGRVHASLQRSMRIHSHSRESSYFTATS